MIEPPVSNFASGNVNPDHHAGDESVQCCNLAVNKNTKFTIFGNTISAVRYTKRVLVK